MSQNCFGEADSQRIELPYTCHHINTRQERLLVDTGDRSESP
jgi:hypothetical protein